VSNIIDSLQVHLPNRSSEQAESLVIALVALLVGTIQLSRATDHKLSDKVLESGRAAAYTLIGAY
jgi:hypothetical protein